MVRTDEIKYVKHSVNTAVMIITYSKQDERIIAN